MSRISSLFLTALFIGGVALVPQLNAEPKENAAAGVQGETATSNMRVQTLAPVTMFQTSIRTTYEKMDVVAPIIEELQKTVREKGIDGDGMIVFTYNGATPDPTKEFELSIGMCVVPGTKGFDKWEVKDVPAFKCATVLHSGNVRTIGQAYQKLFTEIGEKGLIPTGANREFYMYWEGESSDNNVMLIQVGVN